MSVSFKKLLVANRGEIAVRIIRACRELDIKSVAVYSESDANSMYVRMADEAYLLGPSAASESYLNIERIMAVVAESGAEAVHPGYGFLAESAEFARAVEDAGVVWVGPPPEAMEAMGYKVRAKEIARNANVPTVPGYEGGDEDESVEKLSEEADRIGYPVLVKASAGGGGRGMRAVREPGELPDAVEGARREAASAFGDGSVFLEKLVEEPRHIEVQIIADGRGNAIHLFERECSIQRRHQKVVEESPSPVLSDELREEICAAAVRLAKEVGYRNAGTVEFLLDRSGEFFFLEMNARLQVEHPVTELVTGLDLVALQLAVAAGEELPVSQSDISVRGSSIEVRVYAEDERGLPAGGRLLAFDPPEGPGIRNDAGVESGDEVSLDYDSMISKLIVHAPSRAMAVKRLSSALENYTVLGVPTNMPLLKRISGHSAFVAGDTTTDFLERHGLLEPPEKDRVPDGILVLAAVFGSVPRLAPEPFEAGNWRQLGASQTTFSDGSEPRRVVLSRRGNAFDARVGDGERGEHSVEILSRHGETFHALLDGSATTASFADSGGAVSISFGGEEYEIHREPPPSLDDLGSGGAAAGGGLVAPMPGTVVKVMVKEGEEVEEGRLLLVLEAMKMEQPVSAPHAGTVKSLPFAEGEMVPGGATLVEMEGIGSRESGSF
ncbi:MAG: acetyl-CoA carboxylase biotin carboxylase subunit [Rubrobacter sp.]|nr:acetyl-CoA carboxylase biotin carboxylase subunit [Rubrobacter sp.]